MAEQPSASNLRFLTGIMIGAAVALIGVAVWMMLKHQGSPLLLVGAGAMLAAVAAIIAAQAKAKP